LQPIWWRAYGSTPVVHKPWAYNCFVDALRSPLLLVVCIDVTVVTYLGPSVKAQLAKGEF